MISAGSAFTIECPSTNVSTATSTTAGTNHAETCQPGPESGIELLLTSLAAEIVSLPVTFLPSLRPAAFARGHVHAADRIYFRHIAWMVCLECKTRNRLAQRIAHGAGKRIFFEGLLQIAGIGA
jgi:hypothetical protein